MASDYPFEIFPMRMIIHSNLCKFATTVKPVYKGHLIEPENVSFMSRSPSYLYIQDKHNLHYSLMGKMGLPFIDCNLLYSGVL
jgi:hypothetical protein